MIDTLDKQGPDFLEAAQGPNTNSDVTSLAFSSRVLLEILREIRKAHPSQRCVLDMQFSRADKTLTVTDDYVDIRFLASGKPVLAQYLVVSNATNGGILIGLNEPVVTNAAATFGNGWFLQNAFFMQLPVEIEKIQIKALAPAGPIVINNGPNGTGIPVDGSIQVYAWTIPQSDKDATE